MDKIDWKPIFRWQSRRTNIYTSPTCSHLSFDYSPIIFMSILADILSIDSVCNRVKKVLLCSSYRIRMERISTSNSKRWSKNALQNLQVLTCMPIVSTDLSRWPTCPKPTCNFATIVKSQCCSHLTVIQKLQHCGRWSKYSKQTRIHLP